MLDFLMLDANEPLKIGKNSAFSVKYPGKSSIMKNFLMLEHAQARIFILEHARARSRLDFFILGATLKMTIFPILHDFE